MASSSRERVLQSSIQVFGRFGFKKTSVDQLAAAAGLSKQGLYLHFKGKEDIFVACIDDYLKQGIALTQEAFSNDESLGQSLVAALESWFGQHMDTFSPDAFDVIMASDLLSREMTEQHKKDYKALLASALRKSPEFTGTPQSARNIADVLFVCGLSWKEPNLTRAEFSERLRLCVRVCVGVEVKR